MHAAVHTQPFNGPLTETTWVGRYQKKHSPTNTHPDHQTHTHTHLTALCPWLPGWAGTRKVKPICILVKQETVSGSSISWAICKSAPCSRQITMPAPHHSSFLQAGCPSCRPTNSVKALKLLIIRHTSSTSSIYYDPSKSVSKAHNGQQKPNLRCASIHFSPVPWYIASWAQLTS